MFTKVLVANRGEIACRIFRTLDRLGIGSVAVYSEADAPARHVRLASEAVLIGPSPAAESYLRGERILEAARTTGAQAIHPGYGFLSENADFAEACEREGIAFVGPTAEQIRRFGLKHEARAIAESLGVPLLAGSDLVADLAQARAEAERIGYPVMLKSTAGGGGIGMQVCRSGLDLATAYETVRRLGENNFKSAGIFVEKFVERARHVEVQIFGDGRGGVVALGDRDCSVQRRNQKVIEETPAPGIPDRVRSALCAAAVRLGEAVQYRSAGTVEFIYDADSEEFYFLEVNTRLQVEHPVTEAVSGLDLVEWMVRLAAGEDLRLSEYVHRPQGHAIEVRLYAEDPGKHFQPGAGLLTEVRLPEGVRADGWVERGTEVSPYYDPLLVKLIAHGESREDALVRLAAALAETEIAGIETNLDYLRQVVVAPAFRAGEVSTRLLASLLYQPRTVEVLDGGTQTTVQDDPGRIGYWDIGVPPSGPMDDLAFRLVNRLLENSPDAAALECTLIGPTLRFHAGTVICLGGARMRATLDGAPVPYYTPVAVAAGSVLRLGTVEGPGQRTYLAVRHGFDVPAYLESRATFTLGRFGGHGGRSLRTGDVLRLFRPAAASEAGRLPRLPDALVPPLTGSWELGVLYGPHGAPDFFTDADIDAFFRADWKVHHNSARTGVRLIGPKPTWARPDGGEAGLHPSNIHDNAYAIGTVDFTGDMPVILGPDGPSLGGFVCPATVVRAERWKLGQLRPGDTVRFRRLSLAEARRRDEAQEQTLATLAPLDTDPSAELASFGPLDGAVLGELPETATRVRVVYRLAGDGYLLVEYGPPVLDLNLHFRVHALKQHLEADPLPGLRELTPGIRSLQVHYDPMVLPLERLLAALIAAEAVLPPIDEIEVRSRVVHLPLSWEDPQTLVAIEKYMQVVNPHAPWCPSNIEFIRRINGLASIDEVREIVFSASYLVLGLGDVYLGAPVATPLDPRHRLVTTKYNPARTWTPENAVGIGGAYLCIYGMEGPGGYQFVGRTLQVWNRFNVTPDFEAGKPWLLRFFDQIRFYPVAADELLRLREDFLTGRFKLRIEEETFSLRRYNAFLHEIREEAAAFKTRQQAAFIAERERWAALPSVADPLDAPQETVSEELPAGCLAERAPVPANVWQVQVEAGQTVQEGDTLVVLESMKMEIAVAASTSGTVASVLCKRGQTVSAGQSLVALQPEGAL
jgi:urea carboxylase